MPRAMKLTWQKGTGKRAGRWRKKYRGQTYYFAGGRGKTDKAAYDQALSDWDELKQQIDATLPKPNQREYEQAIHEWEAVLTWCRKHNDSQMAETAMTKINRLRSQLATQTPKPVLVADTLAGQFDPSTRYGGLSEIAATIDRLLGHAPDDEPRGGEHAERFVPDRSYFGLEGWDVEREIWKDRLAVEKRALDDASQTVQAWKERFLDEKRAGIAAGDLNPRRIYTLDLHLSHYVDWIGASTRVADINSDTIAKYRLDLLKQVEQSTWKRTTAKDRLGSVCTFVRWLWHVEAIAQLPRILNGKSQALQIGRETPSIVVFSKEEIGRLIREASPRTRLYLLLMLNCGMTQKDISDLDASEVDWANGRITRKRSKTRRFANVPVVSYPLWPSTLDLLRAERCERASGRILLNRHGEPLLVEEASGPGKCKKNDNIKSAFHRLQKKTGIKKPLKSLKKTCASMIRAHVAYSSLEQMYLGHAPQRISDKHYALAPQELFDRAIGWLGEDLGIASSNASSYTVPV